MFLLTVITFRCLSDFLQIMRLIRNHTALKLKIATFKPSGRVGIFISKSVNNRNHLRLTQPAFTFDCIVNVIFLKTVRIVTDEFNLKTITHRHICAPFVFLYIRYSRHQDIHADTTPLSEFLRSHPKLDIEFFFLSPKFGTLIFVRQSIYIISFPSGFAPTNFILNPQFLQNYIALKRDLNKFFKPN